MISISKLTIHVLTCLALAAASYNATAATPTPLPPAAEEALNKGIIAAKVPDYLLAIRYFEEARKLAPQAPVVYLNMGLAESRIPGRELRAMAWFGAYLAAYPDAPNAAAVKEQIAVLEVRNQSNVSRFLKTTQDAANESLVSYSEGMVRVARLEKLKRMAILWAGAGDISAALKSTDLIDGAVFQSHAQIDIAEIQARAGDIAGAKNTLAVALKTTELIKDVNRSITQRYIVEAQTKIGDIAGAQKTADHIQDTKYKSEAQAVIAKGSVEIQRASQRVVTVFDWLGRLDDNLNSAPFLDFVGYLRSLPSSDPYVVSNSLLATADKIVAAQSLIQSMLKQQAKK